MAQTSAVLGASTESVTAEQRARFDRDGYLLIRGALGPDDVMAARDALDRVYAAAARAGSLGPNGSMHQLSAVANCPEVVDYTYRWTAIRDVIGPMRTSEWFGQLTPIQQQLLGGLPASDGDHAWGHYPETTPLYGWLKERGLLDPVNPPLKP